MTSKAAQKSTVFAEARRQSVELPFCFDELPSDKGCKQVELRYEYQELA
jgi:hypothetical protein